jgi:hypothetical protein
MPRRGPVLLLGRSETGRHKKARQSTNENSPTFAQAPAINRYSLVLERAQIGIPERPKNRRPRCACGVVYILVLYATQHTYNPTVTSLVRIRSQALHFTNALGTQSFDVPLPLSPRRQSCEGIPGTGRPRTGHTNQ